MNQEFDTFLQQTISNSDNLCEDLLLQAGFDFIKAQLQAYLDAQGLTALTFTQAIKVARKANNIDTNPRFWSALEAFYLAVGDSIDNINTRKRWLRFVNIIEDLQGYAGSQLINDKRIRNQRVKRLYLAYTLAWEHLRYIAGNDDEYSPSELVLATFTDAFDHDHDDHQH